MKISFITLKKMIFVFLLLSVGIGFAQTKMIDKSGMVSFEASVPSFEEVKAKNESASYVLYPASGEFAGLVMVKSFKFKLPLMEEHFNSDYMKSNTYPKATFKGKIENFNLSTLTASPKEYVISGKIKIHGKTQKIKIIATIRKANQGIEITANFNLNVDDFGIAIPSIVSKKVSKNVTVKFEAALK